MNARYLFPADYMADPAAHVWNGRIWIYPSHDRESGIPEGYGVRLDCHSKLPQ